MSYTKYNNNRKNGFKASSITLYLSSMTGFNKPCVIIRNHIILLKRKYNLELIL